MNKDEFIKVLEIISGGYNEKFKVGETSKPVWFKCLKDLDYKQTEQVLITYLKTNVFPPTIADIRREYKALESEKKRHYGEIRRIYDQIAQGIENKESQMLFWNALKELKPDKQIEKAEKIRDYVLDLYDTNLEMPLKNKISEAIKNIE